MGNQADTRWEFMDLLAETIEKMKKILEKEQSGNTESDAYKVSLSQKSKDKKPDQ